MSIEPFACSAIKKRINLVFWVRVVEDSLKAWAMQSCLDRLLKREHISMY